MVVRGVAGRLDDEDIFAAHVFLNFNEDFLVREATDLTGGQRHVQIFGNLFRKGSVGIARDDFHKPQVLLVRRRAGSAVYPGMVLVHIVPRVQAALASP